MQAGAQWTVTAVSLPTNFPPNALTSGANEYRVVVINTGDTPSSGTVTITDALPAGVSLDPLGASGTEQISGAPLSCSGLECTYSEPVQPGDALQVTIPVDTGAAGVVENLVTVSGGAPEVSQTTPTVIGVPARFGVAPGSAHTTLSSLQAGAHADLTSTLAFSTINDEGILAGDPKDTTFNLPAGFAGDVVDVPACAVSYFAAHNECPIDTQVGSVTLFVEAGNNSGRISTSPVYNLAASPGAVAKLGFFAGRTLDIQGNVFVRPGANGLEHLETTFENIDESLAELDSVVLTIWGVPNDPAHNAVRGLNCLAAGNCFQVNGGIPDGLLTPFLTNPTSCSGAPLHSEFKVDSWQHPSEGPPPTLMQFGTLTGCEQLTMTPSLIVEPSNTSAYSPTGLKVGLEVPQTFENPYGLATSHLKDAVITLPEGMTLNPSAAAGLGSCTEAQVEAETAASLQDEGCPNASKIGTVHVKSPAISEEATGSVYVATPFANRFDSLLALYVVAKIPDRGIVVRLAGKVEPNPLTGQLTTTFDENPQLPFSDFTLSFNQGAGAPLVTPATCGEYTTSGEMSPWSEPSAFSLVSSVFSITSGIGGAPCPAGAAAFAPQLVAGTLNNVAGSYSPFDLHITRGDGEQEITGISAQLPPGLSANLTGVPFCPEADIALARTKTGAQEEVEPSCPAASQIGHSLAGAGVGSQLVYAPGKLYMAGPFEGAPFSIVSITSAKVGPYDLGTVVLHLPLQINPTTAIVTVGAGSADQIPHIIKGIVIHLRDIRVYVDRSNFTLNPTSCNPMSLTASVIGSGQSFTSSADDGAVSVSNHYQASDCANLAFKPSFKLSIPARASKVAGMGLTTKLTFPAGTQGTQANVRYVKVVLPRALPSRFSTLQKACLAGVFDANPAACPAGSVVGHARAVTPILPVPLTGPAYFVSHGGAKFPELVLVLQGYGVTIELHGETNIKSGVTSSTFRTVPDQPVSSFELTLPQGKDSALAAFLPAKDKGDFCGQKLTAPTNIIGQNGLEIRQSTPITVTGCSGKAQKLAAALKACRKKARAKRGSCARAARRRYGSSKKG